MMRILYGVQTTGRGHLVRSRAIIRELKARGHRVRALFSGPDFEPHWIDDVIDDWTHRRGLTHVSVNGRISYWQTTRQLRPLRFLRDIAAVDATGFDLVISDYEPITAQVARRARLPSIGVGHLYAFAHRKVPVAGRNALNKLILREFAPVVTPLGLHWHHFDEPVLPPMIPSDVPDPADVAHDGPVVVYLSFESFDHVLDVLGQVPEIEFRVYAKVGTREQRGHVDVRPISRADFVADLARAAGVICNTGFSLTSEALHLGKRVLTKPTKHQTEQESNALALRELGLATVVDRIDAAAIRNWLERAPAIEPASYPNVVGPVVDWIERGDWSDPVALAERLWRHVGSVESPSLSTADCAQPSR